MRTSADGSRVTRDDPRPDPIRAPPDDSRAGGPPDAGAATSRRRFVGLSAALGVGAFGLPGRAAAQEGGGDGDGGGGDDNGGGNGDGGGATTTTSEGGDGDSAVATLNYLLTVEHVQRALYREGLGAFDREDFRDEDVDVDLVEDAEDHEGAHVDALSAAVRERGGEPVAEARYNFGFGGDLGDFVAVARRIEELGVAAYAGALPSVGNDELLTTLLSIHSVEARHAAVLAELAFGDPFPNAFDLPRSREEVLRYVDLVTVE